MLLPLLLASAQAATLTTGPGQTYATLQDAVAAAGPGDLITIQPMTITGPIVIDGVDLTISALGTVVWEGADVDLLTVRNAQVSVLGITFHPDGGRAVRVDSGGLELSNSELSGNQGVAFDGAGLAVLGPAAVALSHVVLRDNAARGGGPLYGIGGHLLVAAGSLTCDDCTLTSGAAIAGGAVWVGGGATALFTGSRFAQNTASDDGGALRVVDGATVTLRQTPLSANSATGDGGALSLGAGCTVTFDDLALDGNQATADGGGVAIDGVASFTALRTVWTGNEARHGGALHAAGGATVRVEQSSFCGNAALQKGGAAWLDAAESLTIHNSAFVENAARNGGALLVTGGVIDISQTSLLGNTAPRGGAASLDGSLLSFRNNLVAFTQAGSGLDSPIATSLSYNAFFQNSPGDTTGAVSLDATTVRADPLLQGFAVDGQCGDDLRLRALSPLRDAGDPALSDPDATRSDIGAYGGPDAPPDLFVDTDGDRAIDAYDCAPTDPLIHPAATERCDGVDNDCDGTIDGANVAGAPTWYRDADRDGWGEEPGLSDCTQPPRTATLAGDCDDRDDQINPDAVEVCDGVDNDCDGAADLNAADMLSWFVDADADGFGNRNLATSACANPGGYALSDADCDDSSALISPDAPERCDGVDEDCDQQVDDDPVDGLPWYPDADADGWGSAGAPVTACAAPDGFGADSRDCDDADPATHPFAPESCTQPSDRNCDGSTGQDDADADGVVACEDCDDQNADAFPGAPDAPYDGVRLDCDRASDFDADADGYDAIAWGGADCDDDAPTVHPDQADPPDGVNQDCDDETDEDAAAAPRSTCGGCATTRPVHPAGALLLALWSLRRRRV